MKDSRKTKAVLIEELRDARARTERMEDAVRASMEGLWEWPDLSKDELWWSDRFFEILGYAPDEFQPTVSRFLEMIHPDDREKVTERTSDLASEFGSFETEYRIRKKSGEYIWVRATGETIEATGKRPAFMVGSVRDMTAEIDHRQAMQANEQRMEHLNAVLKAIRNVNQLITHEKDRERLLKKTCDCLTETRGYCHAWLLLVNQESKPAQWIRSGGNGNDISFWNKIRNGYRPPCAQKALARRGTASILDPPVECEGCDFANVYENRSTLSIRVEHGGRTFGVLSVSIPRELIDDQEEHALIEEVAGDVAYALSSLEQEERRNRLEDQLKQANLIVENSPAVLFIWEATPGWPVKFVSQNIARFGYRQEDLLSGLVSFESIIHPEDVQRVAQEVGEFTKKGIDEFSQQYRVVGPDGAVFWVDDRTRIERDAEGQPLIHEGILLDITDRQSAETALVNSERFARAIANTTPSLIYIYDAKENRNVWVNEAHRRMFREITADDLSTLSSEVVSSMLHPEDWPALMERLDKLTRSSEGSWEEVEYRIRLPHGEWRWFHDRASIFERDPEGKVAKVIGSAIDITEKKRTEEALRKSEVRFRSIVDALPQMVAYTDKDLVYRFVNSAYERVFGISSDEIVGKRLADFIGEETFEKARAHVERALAGEPVRYEEYYDYPGGIRKHIEGNLIPVPGEDGTTKGYYAILTDITPYKEAEKQVAEQKRMLQVVLDGIPDVIALQKPDHTILAYNAAGYRMLGMSPEEVEGRKCYELLGKVSPCDLCSTDHAITSKSIQTVEKYIPELGQWLETTSIPILDEDGEIALIVEQLRDTTEQRQAEIERHNLEDQLRQAQKMEAVGRLAGGVAHDFNNLLQAINGYTELAMEDLQDEATARETLEEVLKAGERATTLVRQLLAFSRKQTLKLETLDLNELIAGLLKMLGRVIGEHINLSVRPGHGLKPIRADAGQIEQIVMNLCVNARDAMPKGGKLTIETKHLHVDEGFCQTHVDAQIGDYVVLSISDTGEGIDPEIQTSIFEPFFTTKGPGEGTGLGLATVYAITQRHEGFIDLYSEPGHGTTLRVYLPAQESSDKQQSDDEPSLEDLHGNETILIAEDNQQVRILARRILESAGYKVILARDGHEAMRLFELNIDFIDLALLDVIMPGASGGAVLEKIRARKPDIPVLLSSGYSDDVLKSADLPDSEYQMLHKPYSTEELLTQVRKMLDQDKISPV